MLPSLAAGSTERVAKLTAIKGDVKIKLAGGAKPFKAINNMAVTKGDTLFTGKSSSVQLNLDDGSKVVVGSSAQVMVSDLVKNTKGGNQTGIKVQNGQVWSKVKSLSNANDSFKYETPTAVMGIRGTMLFIDASLSQSGLWVTEGAVGVANSASPTGREAFVISNERIESTSSEIRGGLIDAELLAQTLDPEILPEATQDIIHAIYEVAGPNPPNGIGKGLSNEFLKQAKDFIHAAKEKDPTIPVPVDFDQVVEQVIEQIEQHLETNPNPPGVTDSNSNIPPIPENQLHPTNPTSGTIPPTGKSGGGTTSGGGNGDGGGNGGGGSEDDPELRQITFEPSSLLLHEGKTEIITVHAKFDDNSIKNITDKAIISVENQQVATVSPGGVVTAVKAGETTISASFEGKQAVASIKVIKDVQSIAITPVITTIKAGKSVPFKATATMIDETTVDLTREANWSVTNSDVFWVYPDGMGKAKNVGEVEVTASFEDKSSTLAITVVEDIESIGISPDAPEVIVGDEIKLKAYSVAEDGSHNRISDEVFWSSSNEKAAIINDHGKVEGLEKGTTTITARYQKWSATTVLTVKSDNFPPKASDVHITGKPEVDSTLTGNYHYSDDDEDKEGVSIISWYRADDKSGTNKTAIAGATTVQYKVQEADKGKYLSFAVTPVSKEGERVGEKVESAPVGPVLSVGEVESITLTPLNPVVKVADTVQFQVIGKLKDGTTKPLTAGLVWTVSNNAVASIGTNGLAKGLDGGSTLVTASYDILTASTTLTVEKPMVNTPPKATNVTISGTPVVGEMLTGSYTYSDTENDPAGSHLFKWYRANDLSGSGKTVIAGATSTNYTIQIDDAGKFIFFEITPVATKGEQFGTPALSAPVSVPLIELAPNVKSVDVFDDDGTFGDGTYLVLAFTKDLDESSYLSLKSFFSSEFGIASTDTKPYMGMSDTFKIALNSSVPIALGGSFTIPKENIWDGMNNHPSANQVVVLSNVMTTPQGITIHPFVDSNADPGIVNGTLTFSKAANESTISKYKVYIRDNTAILQVADILANTSPSYSVTVNATSSYATHQYDIQVIPYSHNDHEGHAVTMPIIDSKPTIINTELFDDDSNYGAGSMLAIRFSAIAVNSLSDISQYIANSSEFGSVAASDISLGNTDGISGLDTIFVKLYDGIPISQGSSFTIPKEKLYEMTDTSYAARDAVLTIPTQMISSNGIAIDPFIDTEIDPAIVSGIVTFSKALDETGIQRYTVSLYNNNNSSTPVWSTDAPANGNASHSVTISNIPIIVGNSYSLAVKPFSTVGHYGVPVSRGIGPEISGVINGKTYATVTPVVSGSYTTVELKKNGTVVPGYTIGTAITDQGSYVLTVSDSNGNTQAVSFTIQTYASNISISLEPGNEYFSTKFTNALAPGEKLWLKMSSPDGMVLYGSDVPVAAAYVGTYPYFLIGQNDLLKPITVFITDSDNKVIKWGTSQLNSPLIELPPGSPLAVDLSGTINDALFTEDEIATGGEELNIHLPTSDNSTPFNYKVGDKIVAEFAEFVNDPQHPDPYVELNSTTPPNAKISVSGYFDQFDRGRDVVIPFVSVYSMDNYTQLPVPDNSKYKTNVPIKVDTRTFVESDLVVDTNGDGFLNEGDKVVITFTGAVESTSGDPLVKSSKELLEEDFAAMNKFGTSYTAVWTNSDKTVEITLGNGEDLEFNQYIYLTPSHITIGGTPCSDPVVEVFLTKP